MSKPLDEALKSADSQVSDQADPKRSHDAAKESANGYSNKERAPLAASKDPMSKPGITFASQDKLPKLPIPDLESSCKKYITALQPLQTPREHAETESAVHDFLRAEGPELQERLKKYATGKSSYIEQFCKYSPRICLDSTPDAGQGTIRT